MMPVRKIATGRKTTSVFLLTSKKNNRVIECESTLERDMARRLEFEPRVISYEEQPEVLRIQVGDIEIKTIPDFKVTLTCGGIEYVEVKYEKNAREVSERLVMIRNALKKRGITYRVMTEKNIRNCRMILNNCEYLNGFRFKNNELKDYMGLIGESEEISFNEMVLRIGSDSEVMKLIANQYLFCDLYQRINKITMLRGVRDDDYRYMYPPHDPNEKALWIDIISNENDCFGGENVC